MRGQISEVGNTRVAPNGYHYTKTEDGWRLTHHCIMELHLGRKLRPGERVHFKSGDKTDFSEDNLVLIQKGTVYLRKRKEQLEARIEELQTELAEIKRELTT